MNKLLRQISKKKSKNRKNKKHNKTRKYKGGNNDNNGYVLAGFSIGNQPYVITSFDNVVLRNPIFLLKEKTLKNTLPKGLNNERSNGIDKRLFIPILYDLNFRGLILNGPNSVPYNVSFSDGEELHRPKRKMRQKYNYYLYIL